MVYTHLKQDIRRIVVSHFENFKKEILDAYRTIPRQESKFVVTKCWTSTDLRVTPKIALVDYVRYHIDKTNTIFKSALYNAIIALHGGCYTFMPCEPKEYDVLVDRALRYVTKEVIQLAGKNLSKKEAYKIERLIYKQYSNPKLAEGMIILYNYKENNQNCMDTIHNIAETLKLMSNKYGSR